MDQALLLTNEILEGRNLIDIGNTIGDYVKVSEQTRQLWHTSYAHLCIYFDISQELPEAIELTWEDNEWIQPIDYEKIHFICRRCYEQGHLFHDCLVNRNLGQERAATEGKKNTEGFTKVTNRKRTTRKIVGPEINKKVHTHNRFDVLQPVEAGEEAIAKPT